MPRVNAAAVDGHSRARGAVDVGRVDEEERHTVAAVGERMGLRALGGGVGASD